MKAKLISALFFLTSVAGAQTRQHTLVVDITNFRSSEGKAYVALQNPDQKAVQRVAVPIRNGATRVIFQNVPPGKYAVRLFHDENNNQQLDTGIFGIPKESWGCSNNVQAVMGPPRFEEMLFALQSNKTIVISMN